MPELHWTKDTTFVDRSRDFRAEGEGVYDVPEDAKDDYLDHPTGGWKDPDDDEVDPESEDADADADESEVDQFDVDEFTSRHYSARAEAVREGEVDAYLDDIERAESSSTVKSAVEARRAELVHPASDEEETSAAAEQGPDDEGNGDDEDRVGNEEG